VLDIIGKSTEELEAQLKQLSSSITADRDKLSDDQSLFQSISVELKNRREAKDEQPTPTVEPSKEEALANENARLREENRQLVLKVISMESEQAKLVVAAEVAKAMQREAEEKLALVVKYIKNPSNTEQQS
jgi:hypothetical protein